MKKLILVLFLSSVAFTTFSQRTLNYRNDENPSFGDRLFFGGGLGFGGGNNSFSIQVNPVVGYMITPRLSAGVGLDYQYIKYNNPDFNDNLWGGQLFTRYNIKMFFAQAEYNIVNYTDFIFNGVETIERRENVSRFLIGGGISQPMGRRGAVNIAAMYDVLYENNGPFGSPWVFRIYFSF